MNSADNRRSKNYISLRSSPKAKRTLVDKDESESTLPVSSGNEYASCKRGNNSRPQRTASRAATMMISVQTQMQQSRKVPSQARLASITAMTEAALANPDPTTLRSVAFFEPAQNLAYQKQQNEEAVSSESCKESEAEAEPAPKKSRKGKLSRKKKPVKSIGIMII